MTEINQLPLNQNPNINEWIASQKDDGSNLTVRTRLSDLPVTANTAALEAEVNILANTVSELQLAIANKYKITRSTSPPVDPAMGDIWEQTDSNGFLQMRWHWDGKWKSTFLKKDLDLIGTSSMQTQMRIDYQYGLYISQVNYYLNYETQTLNLTDTSGFDVVVASGLPSVPNLNISYRNRLSGFTDTRIMTYRKEVNLVSGIIDFVRLSINVQRVGSIGYPNVGLGMIYQLIYR